MQIEGREWAHKLIKGHSARLLFLPCCLLGLNLVEEPSPKVGGTPKGKRECTHARLSRRHGQGTRSNVSKKLSYRGGEHYSALQ